MTDDEALIGRMLAMALEPTPDGVRSYLQADILTLLRIARRPPDNAAFINALADEGTKEEAIGWLQKTWTELQSVRQEAAIKEEARAGYEKQWRAAVKTRDAALELLFDVLDWIDKSDPELTAAVEAKFGLDLQNRRVK